MKLTREQVMTLAGAASCDPRTIVRIYDGQPTKPIVRERVAAAAKKLKLPVAPAAK